MLWHVSAEAEQLMFCQVGMWYTTNSLFCDMTIGDQPAAAAGNCCSDVISLLVPAVQ